MPNLTGPPLWERAVSRDPERRYGLDSQASVVTVPDGPDSNALRGVIHEVNNCGRIDCVSHDCDTSDVDKFADQHEQQWVETNPFTVYAVGPSCEGMDADTQALARRRARERLQALEWAAVERAVLSGMCGASPYLAGPPADGGIELEVRPATPDGYTALADWTVLDTSFVPVLPAGTDPVPPWQALAYLEWGLRDYGGAGVIHVPSYTFPWWKDWLWRDGSRLVTQLGHGWVFGRGYWSLEPGTSDPEPEEPPDMDSAWIYATGAVRVWRSPIIEPPIGLDYRQNRVMSLAERTYNVSIQCPYVAVNVDLTEKP